MASIISKLVIAASFVLSSTATAESNSTIGIESQYGAESSPVFQMGTPTFFGSGCPANSVRVITASDGQSVSVLFSDYLATTTSRRKRVRKSCNLAVPVDVKRGVSLGVFRVDYRGYSYVPEGDRRSYSKFDAEYYFAGKEGPKVSRKYRAGTDKDLFISNKLAVGAVTWSPCGASTNFRINTAITAFKKNAADEDVEIAIDSADATVEESQYFKYYFTWRKC